MFILESKDFENLREISAEVSFLSFAFSQGKGAELHEGESWGCMLLLHSVSQRLDKICDDLSSENSEK